MPKAYEAIESILHQVSAYFQKQAPRYTRLVKSYKLVADDASRGNDGSDGSHVHLVSGQVVGKVCIACEHEENNKIDLGN